MTVHRPRAATIAPLLIYVSLAILLTADTWRSPATQWVGGCCDPEQTMWFLRWIPHAIEHGINPFVTNQINAPAGVNLMWNASIPILGLVLSPVTLIAGPIVAYNLAIVASITLSAWCCWIVLRRLASGAVAPLVGGAVYGFSPYVISHGALHLNLAAAWTPPLVVLLLDELLIRRRHGPRLLGIALGLLAASQLLTSEEVLATSAVSAAILVGVLAIVAFHRGIDLADAGRRLVAAIIPAGVVFAGLAAWPLSVQFLGPQRIQGRVQDLETFSTDFLNIVLPTRYQWISPDAATSLSDHFSGLSHEATAYVGLPLLVLLTIVIVAGWSDLRVRAAGLIGLIMFVLSLGPVLQINTESTGWPMPWAPFSQLPLLEHALPGRFTLFMWLAVAAIVAIAVDRLRAQSVRYAAPGLIALAAALAVVAPAPLRSSTAQIPPFFDRWEQQGVPDDAVVLVAPYFTDGAGADPMLWAAVAGDDVRMYEAYAYVPLPDGRPSYGPPSTQLSRIMETIQDDGQALVARGQVREQVAGDLAAAGITHVIVGPLRYRQAMVGFFSDLFGRPPLETDGVELWKDVNLSGVVLRTD